MGVPVAVVFPLFPRQRNLPLLPLEKPESQGDRLAEANGMQERLESCSSARENLAGVYLQRI